ncbi:MAG: hypothetical protein ACRCUY_09245 [Thermoguttaceae bacterium]
MRVCSLISQTTAMKPKHERITDAKIAEIALTNIIITIATGNKSTSLQEKCKVR